jgi:lysophospholipase L1-like esterase
MRAKLPEGLFEAGQQTAGVRLRLRTNTRALSVKAHYPRFSLCFPNLTQYNIQGISVYVDGVCWSVRVPGMEGGQVEWPLFSGVSPTMRDICIYLPLYGPVEILGIGIDEDADVAPPTPFVLPRPIVFYGTSITQGGCASRPGLSYQGMLSRRLHVDYANFGFSGKGRCEEEVAVALAQIEACCFMLDVGQNNGVPDLRERFAPFLGILRQAQPGTPVLVTTPIFYNAELWSEDHRRTVEDKREIIRSAVRAQQGSGGRVFLLEAEDYLGADFTDGAVDGGHPNDLGFTRMATGMAPRLAEILDLEDSSDTV